MIGRRVGALAPFGRARSTLQRDAVFHSISHVVRWVKIDWVGGAARSVKNFASEKQHTTPRNHLTSPYNDSYNTSPHPPSFRPLGGKKGGYITLHGYPL